MVLKDSRHADEHASDPHLKEEFATRAERCALAARELQDLVVSLGGKPAVSPSLSGTLHRRWVDIKAAILGKDDEAILNECERGEDVAGPQLSPRAGENAASRGGYCHRAAIPRRTAKSRRRKENARSAACTPLSCVFLKWSEMFALSYSKIGSCLIGIRTFA